MRGMAASNSSIRFTLAAKLPSSPVLSVYLKWMKKKSYFAQFCFEHVDLLGERLGLADDVHADQPGEPFVHRDRRRSRRPSGRTLLRSSAASACRRSRAASGRWPSADRPESCGPGRRTRWPPAAVFSLPRLGDRIERRHAGGLRIGVVHVAAQARAAKHDDEAMLLHRLDEDFDAGNLHRVQLARPAVRFLRWRCGRRGDR